MRDGRAIAMALVMLGLACSGASASKGQPSVTAAPTFSPPGDTYASAQTVTVASATPEASVRCTDDGSTPTAASPSCPAAITVSATITLKAIATAAGLADSGVVTATYTIDAGATPAGAPTFSPAAGSYASAQTVTVASATPGATIHCTKDGSAPTAASPDCTAPFAVSRTTTVRAVATAPGHTRSDEASATYTITSQSATLLEQLQALSTKRQLFGHQSVGAVIMYGKAGTGGLNAILQANSTAGVQLVSSPSALSQVPAGSWAEYELGANGDPIGKIDAFDALVRTTFQGKLDYVAMKFCFADFGESTDVGPIWSRYQTVMDALEASYPGRVIHWTVPLLPWVEGGANLKREQMSDYIRGKYGSTGRVFDLAWKEKHGANGALVTRDDPTEPGTQAIPAMAYEWCGDWAGSGTASDGHPNDTFATQVARDYIEFMYQVATR